MASTLLGDLTHDKREQQKQFEERIDSISVLLDGSHARTVEMEKDAFAFKREAVVGQENSPGQSDKVLRYFEKKLLNLDSTMDKLRLKQIDQNQKLGRLQIQLRQREDVGESVHYIDFHQVC